MKKNASGIHKIVLCLFELALGVLLLINPVGFTSGILRALGVLLLLDGVVHVFRYFKEPPEAAALAQDLTRGLLETIAGLFCMLKSQWFIVTFPLLTVLYGVLALINGVGKIQWAVDLLRKKSKKWFWAAISAAVMLICSLVILADPFRSAVVLWVFIGVTWIADAILDVIAMIFERKAR